MSDLQIVINEIARVALTNPYMREKIGIQIDLADSELDRAVEYLTKDEPKYIVCSGNFETGHKFFGAFNSHEQAQAWGEKNFDDSGFEILLLWKDC